mmetsp:Transcript_1753/g.6177  ORF Transcript_1753/g.6177 Transcript_1753/m.6177 type:complete len:83 (-) Transcript_1753:62-310(-)
MIQELNVMVKKHTWKPTRRKRTPAPFMRKKHLKQADRAERAQQDCLSQNDAPLFADLPGSSRSLVSFCARPDLFVSFGTTYW